MTDRQTEVGGWLLAIVLLVFVIGAQLAGVW